MEKTPLGNAGALYKLKERISIESFLLLNADAVFDVDFNRMVEYHKAYNALATLFTHLNSHPYDSGLIFADEGNHVQAWLAKEFNIDLSQSYMVGDSKSDIIAGITAGCKSILINGEGISKETGKFGQYDTLYSLSDFVDKYL